MPRRLTERGTADTQLISASHYPYERGVARLSAYTSRKVPLENQQVESRGLTGTLHRKQCTSYKFS